MTQDTRLVVVGASLAGLRAVEAARKAGHDGPITLIGAEPHLPYDRPPLSKQFFEAGEDPVDTSFRDEGYLEGLGVEVILGHAASKLDSENRQVSLEDGRLIDYDRLIVATGVTARDLPGTEQLKNVVGLRTVEDARKIRDALDRDLRVAIVGCGFIGSEVASSLWKRGRAATLVEVAPVPLTRAVGSQVGSYFADLHLRHGVDLRVGTAVERVEEVGHELRISLGDGDVVGADVLVLGLGAAPATQWLAGSGIELAADGSVRADATMRSSLPDVYAAGDVVTWRNGLFDREMRLEHWTSAAEQAAVAARNAVMEGHEDTYETVPYFWSDLYDKRIQFVGVHGSDEVLTIGDDDSQVVLYREGDRLSAALTVDQPRLIMKLRRLISARKGFEEGIDLVHTTLEKFAATA